MAYQSISHGARETSPPYTARTHSTHEHIDPDGRVRKPELTSIALNERQHPDPQPARRYVQRHPAETGRQHIKNHAVHYWVQPQTGEDQSDISKGSDMKRGVRSFTWHIVAWAPEAVWCCIAAVLLVSLVIVLNQYNNQPLPEWPLGLTLNTAVALITTVLRSVTVVVICEAISQLKWNRFVTQERRLSDLHVFDQASRGPWGSLLMVLRGRGGILGMTAALVFVTGLATSTITQSAISYSTRLVVSTESKASIMRSTEYGSSWAENVDVIDGESPFEIENTAFQAVYQPADQPWPMAEPTCSSGDCRWKTFSSLALCYDMQNVTDSLNITFYDLMPADTEQNATLTLPVQGDFYLTDRWSIVSVYPSYHIFNMTSPWPNLGDSASFLDADLDSFPRFRESIAHANDSDILRATASQWFAIYTPRADRDERNHHYRAVELLWHFCVKTYNVTVEGGKTKRDVVATSTKVRDGQGYGFDLPLTADELSQNFTLLSESDDSKFSVYNTYAYKRLDRLLRSAFEGGYSTWWSDGAPFSEFNRGIGKRLFAGVGANMTIEDSDERIWGNMEILAAAVSDAVTDFMHKKGTSQAGEVLVPETFVEVRWAWITFVAAQVGLSVVFFICIACHTARLGVDVVKSSNLSELFALRHNAAYSQLPSEAAGLRPLVDPSIVARLEKSEDTWALEVSRQPVSAAQGLATSLRR